MQLHQLTKRIKQKILSIVSSSRWLQWRYIVLQSYMYKRRISNLDNRYHKGVDTGNTNNKRVVFLCDERNASGGLVDRLRGIVSIYKTCKEYNIDFRILFTEPFELDDYLQANLIEWNITPDDLNYNLMTTDICHIGTPTRARWMAEKQEKWFQREFRKKYSEYHVITNASYSYYYNFSELFSELFKPSRHLQELIDKQKLILGESYISISCRFRDLLNDFNETCPLNLNLSSKEQEDLICRNLEQLEKIHRQNPGTKILVNSDSIRFLTAANEKEYTYVIPGEIGHIDNKEKNYKAQHDKTFTDFFMIANAKHIYLFQTGFMFESGFPWAASLVYNHPFTHITF